MRKNLGIALIWLVIFIAYGVIGSIECADAQRGYVGTSLVFVAGR
jgi:hypothetical protein